VKDSLEFTEEGDTIWIKRAEKLFKNIGEINKTYLADSDIIKKYPVERNSGRNSSGSILNTGLLR